MVIRGIDATNFSLVLIFSGHDFIRLPFWLTNPPYARGGETAT
jgi:hypothetical protein